MLQIHSTQGLDQVELGLRLAVERHGGSILAVSHAGRLLRGDQDVLSVDAITCTVCFSELYAPLLRSEIRFAAFLPSRIAVCATGDSILLEAISPRECCRMLRRPELEPLAAPLENTLRLVMEEAAQRRRAEVSAVADEHPATEDQVNMGAALPQRIDCHGTKVEELAGTGVHDSQGG
jgi:uncharacterized protein (DUF302 family)